MTFVDVVVPAPIEVDVVISQGTQGPMGPPGPAGADGPQGAQGPQGIVGPPGIDGEDGPQGPQGEIGPQGPTGATGATGSQGPKGDTGEQGIQGPIGNTGPAGPAGGSLGFPYTVRADMAQAGSAGIPNGPNHAIYHRLIDAGDITYLWYQCTIASGNISLGLFGKSGTGRQCVPGTRYVTTGAILCPAAGQIQTTVGAVSVPYGDWIGISADNTSCTFLMTNNTGQNNVLAKGMNAYQASAHPLPVTPIVTIGSGRTYLMGGG
jgi:hypothetical protein